MHWIALIAWLGLCFGVAGLGAWWAAPEIPGWYKKLRQPPFAPPNRVFGPVWTLLYVLMAVAAWRVSLASSSGLRTLALSLFIAQLVLNLTWSCIFFKLHAIGTALLESVVLWAAVGATTIVFSRISPLAAGLLAPYCAWVTFAILLNGAFWLVN